MSMRLPRVFLLVASMMVSGHLARGQEDFRIPPYLQNPAPDGMTVIWFTDDNMPGTFMYRENGTGAFTTLYSTPVPAVALAYPEWEDTTYFGGNAPAVPYRHRIRMEGLDPGTLYEYHLIQGVTDFSGEFRTVPEGDTSIRFIVYADCETEPESHGDHADWTDPLTDSVRLYLVDQARGYRNNLEVIRNRDPDLVIIAGDLVESGGEQRDWDEFWLNNASGTGSMGITARVPLLAAPGNHEYYSGPCTGEYGQPASEMAVNKFLTYFEQPPNRAPNGNHEGRYYAITCGPADFLVLDANTNSPNFSGYDTNIFLLGEGDEGGGHAPDFMPGSDQYLWLEEQLACSQQRALFTFVIVHQAPYSSGLHGRPPGTGEDEDSWSGVPLRELTPLFMKYGVDAVFSGHDELWERSEVPGEELLPDGTTVARSIQFYDVGVGGDGLRASLEGLENPYRAFLAHADAPEVWEDGMLVDGGKHYGHLEVNIRPGEGNTWEAVLDPVYILPVKGPGDTVYTGFERRLYEDRVIMVRQRDSAATGTHHFPGPGTPAGGALKCACYPNPFHAYTLIGYVLPGQARAEILIRDLQGRAILIRDLGNREPGSHEFRWDGRDASGYRVPPGIYFCRVLTGTGRSGMVRMVRY